MYGHQSQAFTTRLASLGASFKKTLRLNRDQLDLRQIDCLPSAHGVGRVSVTVSIDHCRQGAQVHLD